MQIDITNISHTVEETVSLIVSDEDGNVKFNLPIRLYNRPQLLPLRTAEWAGNDAEKFYIEYFNCVHDTSYYNLKPGGDGGCLEQSDQTKEKLSH